MPPRSALRLLSGRRTAHDRRHERAITISALERRTVAWASNRNVLERKVLVGSAALGLVLTACTGTHTASSPRQTVVAYYAAVTRHDRQAASALVCPRFATHPFVFELSKRHGVLPELTPTSTKQLSAAHWAVETRLRYGHSATTSGPPVAVQRAGQGRLCVRALISHG